MAIIELSNVCAGYPSRPVLEGVNLTLEQGEMVGLLGPNGSGKTTLFRVISGTLPVSEGTVRLFDRPVVDYTAVERARLLGVLPQILEIPFSFTCEEVVSMGRFPHIGRFEGLSHEDRARVEEAMEQVNALSLRDRSVQEISGGERQRVLLAQALAQDPKVLLLDEPVAHLDVQHQVRLFELLLEIHGQGMTVLVILHDLNLASLYLDRVILLRDGRIHADGPPSEVIHSKGIEDVFGISLEVGTHPDSDRPAVYYRRRS